MSNGLVVVVGCGVVVVVVVAVVLLFVVVDKTTDLMVTDETALDFCGVGAWLAFVDAPVFRVVSTLFSVDGITDDPTFSVTSSMSVVSVASAGSGVCSTVVLLAADDSGVFAPEPVGCGAVQAASDNSRITTRMIICFFMRVTPPFNPNSILNRAPTPCFYIFCGAA